MRRRQSTVAVVVNLLMRLVAAIGGWRNGHTPLHTYTSMYIYIYVVMVLIAAVLVNCFIDASRLQTNKTHKIMHIQTLINIEFMRTPFARRASGFGSSDLI